MDCKTKVKALREMTVTEWELDNRHAPSYVLRLLEYYIRNEGLIQTPGNNNLTGERSNSHEKAD